MLSKLIRYYGNRNFSQSRICRNLVKSNSNTPQESPETPKSTNVSGPLKMDFVPNEFEKKILVWSGKFKSKEDIPHRIGYGTLEDAKSRFRIRASNVMMVLTVFLCLYYIWKGKSKASQGYTINKLHMEKYGIPSMEK